MAADTGFSSQDAQSDFSRARRGQVARRLANRLRREPDDIDQILPFDEVLAALGKTGERRLGIQSIELDSVVGTVDRGRDFDRRFRPTSHRVRQRWQGINTAMRKGKSMPPIDVYRVGEFHFVEDGHHRVSVARQMGIEVIDASVTEIQTSAAPESIKFSDLPLKSQERLFFERVPLAPDQRSRIELREPRMYAQLAESVEAWGFRAMQAHARFMSRGEVAELWFHEEYEPVVEMLREAGLLGDGTETEAHMVISGLRYLLLRTHEWDETVIERIREAINTGEVNR
ncbi:MAG: chromosome partitioning protein ParB [Thermoleophilia bacterium]|nr:chromosome partitioning protein ParB [Thermoleophilia bacterium]